MHGLVPAERALLEEVMANTSLCHSPGTTVRKVNGEEWKRLKALVDRGLLATTQCGDHYHFLVTPLGHQVRELQRLAGDPTPR